MFGMVGEWLPTRATPVCPCHPHSGDGRWAGASRTHRPTRTRQAVTARGSQPGENPAVNGVDLIVDGGWHCR